MFIHTIIIIFQLFLLNSRHFLGMWGDLIATNIFSDVDFNLRFNIYIYVYIHTPSNLSTYFYTAYINTIIKHFLEKKFCCNFFERLQGYARNV